MNWLRNKINDWLDDGASIGVNTLTYSEDYPAPSSDPVLKFRIFDAVGGKIVEFKQYDRHNDKTHSTTYIIRKGDDFGEAISKIANMEMMK